MRWALGVGFVLVIAYLISLLARETGSDSTLIDGWGVNIFEIAVGVVCCSRFLTGAWRSHHSVARAFPLIFGVASVSWALGDVALTIESFGGATPAVPSVADGFYVCFFPLCFTGLALLIRGGNRKSFFETSLDGLVAGLEVASISANVCL